MLNIFALVEMASLAAAPCLSLEPAVVELVGTVEERTYWGPPNYGEQPTDTRETQLVLVLLAPICVVGADDNSLAEPRVPIAEVTLVLSRESSQPVPRNRRLKVVGTLFEAHTGHHHTPVLISVRTVTEVV